MLNYDFRNLLSPFEFECFSRDIINAHEGLNLMSFAEGRDCGIDLRYTNDTGHTVIVQSKRYNNYSELKSSLKSEIEKVKKLRPQRYILTTSVDLTVANKNEILSLFTPYIKNENDIIAKQDLNRLLAKHPDIERQYYKLWLSSTNVLEGILKSSIINWTNFEKKEIEASVRTYVMNNSFNDALDKLKENKYVIISGEPGIGKTTLARVIVMYLLSDYKTDMVDTKKYHEFYFTYCNIEDLTSVFKPGVHQVFFYDDFLGQVTLEEGEKNFDGRIIKFIKGCQRENNKYFILTTREYILQQGLTHYSRFNEGKGIEMSKCIVDMGKYTRFVRAQILYNHLVDNEIPQAYINTILKDKNYLKLIDHPHFSPRIIETFLKNGSHEQCTPDFYFNKILSFFDHPDSVWLDAFNRLSDIEKEALLVLNTMGTPVMCDDWQKAYDYFYNNVHKESNYLEKSKWNNALKVLQNNFIRIGQGHYGEVVEFHNPGIKDVLNRYIELDNNMKRLLLENSIFIDQVLGVFKNQRQIIDGSVSVPSIFVSIFISSFNRIWNNYRSCKIILNGHVNKEEYYIRKPLSRVYVLDILQRDYGQMINTYPFFVEKKMTQQLMTDVNIDLADHLSLLEKVDLEKTSLDMDFIFDNYVNRLLDSVDCLNLASSIEMVFPNHTDFLYSEEFCGKVAEYLKQDLRDTKDSDLEELDGTAQELCNYIPLLESESIISDIRNEYLSYSDYIDAQAEDYQDDYRYGFKNNEHEDAWQIDNLFNTIKERN